MVSTQSHDIGLPYVFASTHSRTRQRVELLAKSKEFATDYTDYMPR